MYWKVRFSDVDGFVWDLFVWIPTACAIPNIQYWKEYCLRQRYRVKKVIGFWG